MTYTLRSVASLLVFAMLPACSASISPSVRIATFNTALSRASEGELHAAFETGSDEKAKLVAEVIQRTRPDIVLLQEIDYDPTGKAYADFQRNYLSQSHNGAEPINYEHIYAPPVNTGILADVDLDGDGKITRPNDGYGYGLFDGHYGMVVLSKYPIQTNQIASFRKAIWKDMPANNLPTDYYSATSLSRLRLSSKTHAIVPILIGDQSLNLLISHPTPPVFDGPEDRNGRRNFDEIGLWAMLLTDPSKRIGSRRFPVADAASAPFFLDKGHPFILLGDLNADPNDGESRPGAIQQILTHKRINASITPTSQGALQAATRQAGNNLNHRSDPAADTADFADNQRGPGNLRVDYVLPSIGLGVINAGVYWPTTDDPHAYLNNASDHKLVWIDIQLP